MRTFLLTLVLAPAVAAQSSEPGYRTRNLIPLPAGAAQVAVLPQTAEVVWFTGTDLVVGGRGATRTLLTLPAPVFGSFTIDAGNGRVLFGESSTGDLWLCAVQPGGPRPRVVANLPFNYDAVPTGPDTVVVSAKSGGFGAADNELIQVDLRTGATDLIARIAGASGPVAWTPDGLFYATASAGFPPPPGATDVLHWSRAQVRAAVGPTHLTARDAAVVARGIDAASDLAVDADLDLLVTDWVNGRVFEVSFGPAGGRAAELRRSTLLAYAPADPQPAALALVEPPGLAQFEPFQGEAGGTLFVHEATFGGTSRVRELVPVRPVTTVPASIPAGPFAVVTTGGPAHGTGLVAVGPNPLQREGSWPVDGLDAAVLWDPAMFSAWDTLPVVFDARGTATLRLHNPGVGAAVLGAQCAFVDARVEVLGSAAPVRLLLQ